MDNGRPKLGYSSMYWAKIDRKARKKVDIKNLEEEVLEEPIAMNPIECDLIDRIQLKAYADNFCPPNLTKVNPSVILNTSPTNIGEKHE